MITFQHFLYPSILIWVIRLFVRRSIIFQNYRNNLFKIIINSNIFIKTNLIYIKWKRRKAGDVLCLCLHCQTLLIYVNIYPWTKPTIQERKHSDIKLVLHYFKFVYCVKKKKVFDCKDLLKIPLKKELVIQLNGVPPLCHRHQLLELTDKDFGWNLPN